MKMGLLVLALGLVSTNAMAASESAAENVSISFRTSVQVAVENCVHLEKSYKNARENAEKALENATNRTLVDDSCSISKAVYVF